MHRRRNFRMILGEDFSHEEIDNLIENNVDFHDLEYLVYEKNCPRELAVKILL